MHIRPFIPGKNIGVRFQLNPLQIRLLLCSYVFVFRTVFHSSIHQLAR